MNNVAKLKQRVLDAEAERDYYHSLVQSFFTGDVPDTGASPDHFILAKWGRKRHEDKRATAALLHTD